MKVKEKLYLQSHSYEHYNFTSFAIKNKIHKRISMYYYLLYYYCIVIFFLFILYFISIFLILLLY